MSAKKRTGDPHPNLHLYSSLVAKINGVELKGAKMPYTSLNGHMFSFLSPEGRLALRLPEAKRTEFISKYRSGLFEAHGTVLKEYVEVPESLLKKKELEQYFLSSLEYIKTLKPKPTKK